MANFDNNSRVNNAGVTEIIGNDLEDDLIDISSTFLLPGTTSGVIDGQGGSDSLRIDGSNLFDVDISNIEATEIVDNSQVFIDAQELGDLGSLTINNTFANSNASDANLRLNFANTASPSILALAAGSELLADQVFNITIQGQIAGDQFALDFSNLAMASDSRLQYSGGAADETITGTSGNDSLRGNGGNDSIIGGMGDDTLNATSGAFVTLLGGDGDDNLSSSNATGLFDGGADNDTIVVNFRNAAGGPSTVLGGSGMDDITVSSVQIAGSEVDAGSEDDTILLEGTTLQNGTLEGGTGTDVLQLRTSNLSGTEISGIESTEILNNGTVTIDADQLVNLNALSITNTFAGTSTSFDAAITLNFAGAAATNVSLSNLSALNAEERLFLRQTAQSAGQDVTLDLSGVARPAADSLLRYDGGLANETITGTSGDDQLSASTGTNSVTGGDGDDSLSASSGFSTLLGGNGDDTISTSSSSGLFDGGADDDVMSISIGFSSTGVRQASTVLGGSGMDDISVLSVHGAGTQVDAGTEDDTITLNGTTITDGTVDGGAGTDQLFINSTNARGTDFSGIESTTFTANGSTVIDADQIADLGTLSITNLFSNTAADANLSLNYDGLSTTLLNTTSFGALSSLGAGERFSISTTGQTAGQQASIDFSGIGRTETDTFLNFTGGVADETVTGTAGDDRLVAGNGTNSVTGGMGDDSLGAGTGFSTLLGGEGNDTISGSSTSGLFDGGIGDDQITLSVSFSLSGTRQASVVLGGSGSDTITATSLQGVGSRIDAGDDDDTVIFTTADFRDATVDGGSGTNALRINGVTASGTDFENIDSTTILSNNFVIVDADEVTDLGALDITNIFSNASFDANLRLNYAGLGASTSTSFGALSGLEAGERLSVDTTGQTAGQQATLDFSGIARPAADTLLRYSGSTADETITGTSGDDELLASSGTNSVSGGAGDDSLNAGSGFSTLLGGAGDDTISTSGTSGLFDGGADNDVMNIGLAFNSGGRQPSVVLGGTGTDTITISSIQGEGSLVDAGTDDDAIILSNASLRNSTVDGGTGTNSLTLSSTDAAGTDFENIDSTLIINNGFITIDADEIADLGALTITNIFSTTSDDANIRLNYSGLSTASTIVTDFSNLTDLGDGERLNISQQGQTSSVNAEIDLSGIGRSGVDTFVTFTSASGNDTVTGTQGDDKINVGSGTNSVTGGLGDDSLQAGAGFSTLLGGEGEDTLFGSGTSGLLDGGADNDEIRVSTTFNSTGRQPVTVLGGTGMDSIEIASAIGSGSRVDGGADDDTIDLSTASFTSSTVDGGTGTDALLLRATNLTDSDIEGIESTLVAANSAITIDAAEVADLGALTITDTFNTNNTTRDANFTIRNYLGQTADFSALTLSGTQRFYAANSFEGNGTFTFDFSGASGTAGTVIEAQGVGGTGRDEIFIASDVVDDFDGGSGGSDTISYEGSDAAVSVDLTTNTVSGGFADGDVILNFENATGSNFDDALSGTTGVNIMTGLGGDDTYTTLGDDDIVVVSENNGNDTWTDFASGGGVNKVDLRGLPKDAAILGFLTAQEVGGNTVMSFITGGSITLQGEALASFDFDDVILEDGVYAIDEVFSGNEDQTITGNVLNANPPFNFADLEILNQMLVTGGAIEVQDFTVEGTTALVGSTLSFASGATLTVQADGSFVYDPTQGAGTQALSETLLETLDQDWSYTAISTDDGTGSGLGTGETDQGDVSMEIAARNDAPVIAGPVTRSVNEDDAAITIDLLEQSSDVDNGEVLNVTNVAALPQHTSISGNTLSFNPGGSGFQSLNEGQQIQVVVNYDVVDLFGAVTTGGQTIVTVTGINDDPTLAAGTLSASEDGAAVTLDLATLGDDIDAENTPNNLDYAESYNDSEGSASVSGTTLTFDTGTDFQSLAVGETQDVIVDISATDLRNATANNTVTVTVTGVNDDPTLGAASISASEDGSAVTLDLAALGDDIDSDDDGSTLTYTVVSNPAEGSASILGNTLTFDPGSDFQNLAGGETRDVSIGVEADDGNGGTVTTTMTVTVTGVNDDPTLGAGTLAAAEDGATVLLDLSTLGADVDSDDDGSTLLYTVTGQPGEGGASISGTTLSFNPSTDFQDLAGGETRDVTITLSADDENGGTPATNTVTVTVTGVNDDPTLGAGTMSATEDGSAVTLDLATLGDDIDSDDDGASLTYTVTGDPAEGSASILGNTLTFTPGSDFQNLSAGQTRDVTITVLADDGNGGSASNTVTVTVTGVNDDPVATDDDGSVIAGFTVDENSAVTTASVLANDSDIDALDTITVQSFDDTLTTGTVSDNGDGTFDYDTNGQFEALDDGDSAFDTFTYTISDGQGGTDTATVTIEVTGVNDAPVAVDDSVSTDEDTGITSFDVLANDTDVDAGDTPTLTGFDDTGVLGTLISNGDGTFSYDPNGQFESLNAGDTATETFTYTMDDGTAGTEQTGTVTITINGVNDLPIPVTDTDETDEDTPVSGNLLSNDTDVDNAAGDLSVSEVRDALGNVIPFNTATDLPEGGQITVQTNGDYTFSPDGDFEELRSNPLPEGALDSVELSYDVSDGAASNTGSAIINIRGVNDAPTLADGSETASEDGAAVTIDLAALGADIDDDDDGGSLLYTITSGPSEGAAQILGDGTTLEFNPGADFQDLAVGESRDVTVTVEADDGSGGTTSADMTFTVNGTNDAPVITNPVLSFAIDENTSAVTTITSSDADTSDPAVYAIAGGADAALFQIDSSSGALSFIAPPDFETPLDDGGNNIYDVDVSVTDGTDTDVESVQVTVDNVTENAVATVSIGVQPTSQSEGDAGSSTVTFTVTRSGSTAAAVTAALALSGTADGSDFSGAIPPSVTLGVGETSASFTVDILGDVTPEADETISVAIQSLDRGDHAIGVAGATHTILNDDNTAPLAADDGPFAIDEDAGGTTGNVLTNDTDVDTNTLSVSAVDATTALGAAITDNGDGTFSIAGGGVYDALDLGDVAADSFSYTVSDGAGGTDTATVTLEVSGRNDTPTVAAGTLAAAEDGPAVTLDLATLASDADADDVAASLTYALVNPLAGVSLAGSVLEFTPGSGFQSLAGGETTDIAVQVTATDGALASSAPATVTITVTGVDDVPVFSSPAAFNIDENSTSVGFVQATDVDATIPVNYSVSGGADRFLFATDETTGELLFLASPDFEAPADANGDNVYEIVVTADGGNGSTSDQTILVTVDDVLEAPVFNQITGTNANDRLFGTAGADRIDPLGGALDVILGGDGGDIFDFSTKATNGTKEASYIFDFDASEGDLLDLGTASVVMSATLGTNTYINLDGEGDQIILVGVSGFDTDFLL